MNGIYLTPEELDVLSRCSGVAVKAYLRIRARMDIATGQVGVKSGLSYQALREWTEEAVEKGAGEQVVQPTLRGIRTAVDQLVRRGLLRRAKCERLVFKCVLAAVANARPNQTRHEPGRAKTAEHGTEPDTKPDTNQAGLAPNNGAGFDAAEWFEPGMKPDTEPDTNQAGQKQPNPAHIRGRSKPSTPQAASTAEPGLEPEAGVAGAIAAFWSAKKVGSDQPEDQVSRRATSMAVLLRQEQIPAQALNPTLLGWAEQGIRDEQLRAAVVLARQRREAEGSHQPINVGYLNACLQSVLKPPKPKADAWWLSVGAMEAKARELGIAGARPGEEMDAFKARITDALRRQQTGAAA